RGTTSALDHAAGYDANYAAMPPLTVEHHAACILEFRILSEAEINLFEDHLLRLLTVRVQVVQLLRDLHSGLRIARAEEIYHALRYVHTTGGIDARRDAERYIGGGQVALTVLKLRYLHKHAQTRVAWIAQSLQAQFRDDAVLSHERDRVGDGCNRHHLEK